MIRSPSSTFLLLIHLHLLKLVEANRQCSEGNCQNYALDVYGDAVENSEFVGHVFHKFATINLIHCHSLCVDDCRCLSFNYKETNESKVCELNEGSHFTDNSSLKHSPGSRYHFYNLRRANIKKGVTSCESDVTCVNGCCRNNPCVNGGTCQEICEPTSVRYSCSCPAKFTGRHCEYKKSRKSCQAYKKAGAVTSGLHTIIDDSNRTFPVFCDFDAEPSFSWNLIQSFSLSNKHLFGEDVVLYNYSDSKAVSGDKPNWQAYLILPRDLAWLRNQSTHWRATCQYNTAGTVYRDYLRASFEDFDIIGAVPLVTQSCRKYELINIRGNECTNCTAQTSYKQGRSPFHISVDCRECCDFNGNLTGDAVLSEDDFGQYSTPSVNPKFRCTSNSNATTQLWFGGK